MNLGMVRGLELIIKKIVFENIITIYDNNIPLENKGGKGLENIIKTRIALDKEKKAN